MATKDERPGLLSKVAMFVRNPTKDWSELDQIEQPQESGYDKQALKAMIERKRQNDFVRKREFDQLRKLRRRDPVAMASAARPSFFQSSIPTDADGRAVTLKKIDEIEAQMSKQWWKGKQEGQGAGGNFPVASPSADPPVRGADSPTLPPPDAGQDFEKTQVSDLLPPSASGVGHSGDFLHTQPGPGTVSGAAPKAGANSAKSNAISFSTSKLMAMDVDELTTDPELEEAAIRFANGDDAGAENGLLSALRADAVLPESALGWCAALFDLYRATNNRDQFDRAMEEFGGRFDKLVPVWFCISPAEASAPVVQASPPPGVQALWRCPPQLTLAAMDQLRDVLSNSPMPWHLEWMDLDLVASDAMPLLAGLFSSLCTEPVAVRMGGAETLLRVLRTLTPSGKRNVETAWWTVRLDVLRALQLQDEFELAALDYCVTYETSPPAWQDAACSMEVLPTPAAQGAHSAVPHDLAATVPIGLDGPVPSDTLELKGAVLGDATAALAVLDGRVQKGGRIVVSCTHLIRVDFSAAGSILNWVAKRQSDGCQVHFSDAHRLVAAFFNVIGINEHARVIPRPM